MVYATRSTLIPSFILTKQNFQELLPMTEVMSMQKVKVIGQRSRSQIRACSKVLLLVEWVWLVLLSTASPQACCDWNFGSSKSKAPRKTTPHQDHALLRMVRQHHFISARALTAHMRNLYGMEAVQKTINNRLLFRGYRSYKPTRKPLLTTNHCRLCLEWAHSWQNLTMAHWEHVIFGDESRF